MHKRGQVEIRQGANLPHGTQDGAAYSVTFRLADSLPDVAVQRLLAAKEKIELAVKHNDRPPSLEELARLSQAKSEVFLQLLDEGHGACHLKDDRVALMVANALKHFADARYKLFAWCVMPNHVHALFQPLGEFDLSNTLHSWKSFTAKEANKLLGRTGGFWQRESYDHLIRDPADFNHHFRYIRENPSAAGLKGWKWWG